MIISSDILLLIEKKGLSNFLRITYLLPLHIKLSLSITLPSSYCSSTARTFANVLLLTKWRYLVKGLLLSNLWWTISPETRDLSNNISLSITLNCFDDMSSLCFACNWQHYLKVLDVQLFQSQPFLTTLWFLKDDQKNYLLVTTQLGVFFLHWSLEILLAEQVQNLQVWYTALLEL